MDLLAKLANKTRPKKEASARMIDLTSFANKVAVYMPLGKHGPEPQTFHWWTKMILFTERHVGGLRVLDSYDPDGQSAEPSWGVPTTYNRQYMAEVFVKSDLKWLFWVDGDMVFHPSLLCHLLADVLRFPEIQIIGGTSRKSGNQHTSMIYKLVKGAFHHIESWPADHLFAVDGLTTAAMLIHRSVFEQVAPPWFKYEVPVFVKGGYDDALSFCLAVREAGIKIWADPRLELGHIDRQIIPGNPRGIATPPAMMQALDMASGDFLSLNDATQPEAPHDRQQHTQESPPERSRDDPRRADCSGHDLCDGCQDGSGIQARQRPPEKA